MVLISAKFRTPNGPNLTDNYRAASEQAKTNAWHYDPIAAVNVRMPPADTDPISDSEHNQRIKFVLKPAEGCNPGIAGQLQPVGHNEILIPYFPHCGFSFKDRLLFARLFRP